MQGTPAANRLQIGIFGRRNAGKSSFINALTGQNIAIVSEIPGTTTDPVGKTMEIKGLGPVFIYDTAGMDDSGELGAKRVAKTREIIHRVNMGIIVTTYDGLDSPDMALIDELKAAGKQAIVLFSKIDVIARDEEKEKALKHKGVLYAGLSSITGQGIDLARQLIVENGKNITVESPVIIGDLVNKNGIIILVVPIDLGAPKGRIILPQVQVLRDALDHNCIAITVKETGLKETIKTLKKKPDLVICDSQAIENVSQNTPKNIPLTTFSIAFSRLKGDLNELVRGVKTIDTLMDGDSILIMEACTHHAQTDDIGRVKIPKWIRKYTGKDIKFETNAGPYVNKTLNKYKLIISCGACMINRQEMMSRMADAKKAGVPMTNYGLAIAYAHGLLDRVIRPFGININEK